MDYTQASRRIEQLKQRKENLGTTWDEWKAFDDVLLGALVASATERSWRAALDIATTTTQDRRAAR